MRKKLYIVRREAGGIGGAEKVANKFAEAFSEHFDTHLISAGSTINNIQIKGTSGPSWWKCLKFAISSNQFIKKNPNSLILSMERGVPGAIYRAGDGVHKVWIKHKYGSSRKWIFNPLHWTLPLLEKHSIEESTMIVPNSQMVKQHIIDGYDVHANKLKVIYNGYDSNIYYPLSFSQRKSLRQKLHIDNNNINFLFSGSGWERKGLHVAIRFLAEIKIAGKNPFLWVAGKGNKEKYNKVAKQHGVVQRVKFLGSVQGINQWYQAADYMILPTALDPFSNSCLESLACGCPIITSNMNGAAELVKDKINGFILKTNSGKEFKHLAEIIARRNNNHSPLKNNETFQYPSLKEEIEDYINILMET